MNWTPKFPWEYRVDNMVKYRDFLRNFSFE